MDVDLNDVGYIAGLSVIGLCFDVVVCLLVSLVWKISTQPESPNCCRWWLHNKVETSCVITMLLAMISVGYDWRSAYCMFQTKNRHIICDYYEIQNNTIIGLTLYFTAIVFMYISLVLRVFQLFKGNNAHALSKREIGCSIFLLIMEVCVMIVFLVETHFDYTENNVSYTFGSHSMQRLALTIMIGIMDFAIHSMILYLTITKLYKIIKKLVRKFQRNQEMNRLEDNFNIQDEQFKMVNLIAKFSLLSIASVIVAQFWNIVAIYINYAFVTSDDTDDTDDSDSSDDSLVQWYNNWILVALVCHGIEAVTNCIALYFTFIFNQKSYYVGCKCCHEGLKRCCRYCIVKRLVKRRN